MVLVKSHTGNTSTSVRGGRVSARTDVCCSDLHETQLENIGKKGRENCAGEGNQSNTSGKYACIQIYTCDRL